MSLLHKESSSKVLANKCFQPLNSVKDQVLDLICFLTILREKFVCFTRKG